MVIVGPIPSARMLSSVLASLLIASLTLIVYADSSASRPEVAQVDPVPVSSRSEFTQVDPVHSLFEKGSRYWSVAAGASRDESIAWIDFTQISASYYIADNLAIDWGGILGYVSAKRTRGGALGGPEVGLRWHFARRRRTSLFFEGIVGAVVQQNPITEQSLRFNFDLQPGGGATDHLSRTTMLQSGFRWRHLSNARIRGKARNFGYDGPMLYIKLMRSF